MVKKILFGVLMIGIIAGMPKGVMAQDAPTQATQDMTKPQQEDRWLHATDAELEDLKKTNPAGYDRLITRHRHLHEEFAQFKRKHHKDWWLKAGQDKMMSWNLSPKEFEKLQQYRPDMATKYRQTHPEYVQMLSHPEQWQQWLKKNHPGVYEKQMRERDRRDVLRDRRDRRDVFDRKEDVRDRHEDRSDHREDIYDRKEDRWDRRHDRGRGDKLEDVRDRREDRRDHREDIYDRKEDRWDRRHDRGRGDKLEDVRDRHGDVHDRQKNRRDRKEDVHDRGYHKGYEKGIRDRGQGIGAGKGQGSTHRSRNAQPVKPHKNR